MAGSWQWLREHKSIVWGVLGGVLLLAYGVIPTWQAESAFGRVYAAYGGIFMVLSLVWARLVEGWRPDRFDLIGGALALIGLVVIMWGRDIFR